MHILLNSIDADMKSDIESFRRVLRPYPLRFHVEEAGADAKLIQHGPQGVAYHRRHPISTIPVARITAHASVPGLTVAKDCNIIIKKYQGLRNQVPQPPPVPMPQKKKHLLSVTLMTVSVFCQLFYILIIKNII